MFKSLPFKFYQTRKGSQPPVGATFQAPAKTRSRLSRAGLLALVTAFWVTSGLLSQVLAATITSTATGGNWRDASTWVGGTVPTAQDDVIIADGAVVVVDIDAFAKSLTVGQTGAATLQFEAVAARRLTVSGNVLVKANSALTTAATGSIKTHVLEIGGNLTNDGTLDLSTNSNAAAAALEFTGATDAAFSGTGALTDIYRLIVNKGTSVAPVLELSPNTLSVQGSATDGAHMGFLTLNNGTLKISGTFTMASRLFATAAYTIPAGTGIWLNNPNFTVAGQDGSPTNSGLLHISAGTYHVGTSMNNSMGAGTGAEFRIEGGVLNVAGRLNASTSSMEYNQSGGDVLVATVGNNTTTPSFGFTSTNANNKFTMSGGRIIIVNRSFSTSSSAIDVNQVGGTIAITGGVMQFGDASTPAGSEFRARGNMPGIVINNTNSNHKLTMTNTSTVYGNITVNPTTSIALGNFAMTFLGSQIINNGDINNAGGTSTNSRLEFASTSVQTYSGSGTLGTTALPITAIGVNNPAGIVLNANVVSNRINLTTGNVTNSNRLTLGGGAATATTIQYGATASSAPGGNFDVAPVFNIGSGGHTVIYLQESTARTTGFEIPASRQLLNMTVNNSNGITVAGGNISVTNTLTLTSGIVNTAAGNSILVTNTAANAIAGGSAASYIRGPLTRALPASLNGSSNYIFPIGKSEYQLFEMVSPVTTAAGTLSIQAEVFDTATNGTPGTGLKALNTNRYWSATSTGAGVLSSTRVRLTESSLASLNAIGRSATLGGAYNNIGSTISLNTILSNTITGLGYFTLGTKSDLTPGTYQVGPGQQFANLTAVANALNSSTITGNMVFEMTAAYDGTTGETFPIMFNEFGTSGGNWTVIIRPAAGVSTMLTTAGNPGSNEPLINLNGSDRITFDGRAGGQGSNISWTFRNTRATSTPGPVFQFINGATSDTLRYLNIEGQAASVASGNIFFGTSLETTGNSNNGILFCNIRDRFDQFGKPLNGIYSEGSNGKENSNNTIANNNIFNYYNDAPSGTNVLSNGIYLKNNSTAWTISNNRFFQENWVLFKTSAVQRGIFIDNSSGDGFTVTNNIIGGSDRNGNGLYEMDGQSQVRFYAIEMKAGMNASSSIQGNIVKNISLTSNNSSTALGGTLAGIYVTSGKVDIGTVTPNIIGSDTGTGSIVLHMREANTNGTIVGISAYSSGSATPIVAAISNNKIGSLTVTSTHTTAGGNILGIEVGGGDGTYNITGNLIGSTTTANSLNVAHSSTYTSSAKVVGILNTASSNMVRTIIANNTIAGLNNSIAGIPSSATIVTGTRGIMVTSGISGITNNTIFNLTAATKATAEDDKAAVVGISLTSTSSPSSNSSLTFGQIISGNTIYGLSSLAPNVASKVTGIYYGGTTSSIHEVSNNFVHSLDIASADTSAMMYGIYIKDSNLRVKNNMVRLGIDAAGNAITSGVGITGILRGGTSTSSFSGVKLYFNSVYVGGAGVATSQSGTYAFRRITAAADSVYNNIFVNARSNATTGGKHHAIGLNSANQLKSDYNIYLANGTGGVMANLAGTEFNAIQTFQGVSGTDLSSHIGDPQFINPTGNATAVNLHINATLPSLAEGRGLAIASITEDFDGENRQNFTPTDIGADAGNFTPFVYTNAPDCVTLVSPLNGATNVCPSSIVVSWNAPTSGAPVTGGYNVHIGTSFPLPLVGNTTNLFFSAPQLQGNTKYYVQILPVGDVTATACPVDSFTTSNLVATPITPAAARCGTGPVNLEATGSGTITWYDGLKGNAIATGTTFNPVVSANTTYYVGSRNLISQDTVGLPFASSLLSGDVVTIRNYGLTFDANEVVVIDTLHVYPAGTGAGTVTIALRDGNNTIIDTATFNITAAPAVYTKTALPVNFTVYPGSNYKVTVLDYTGNITGFIRTSYTGVTYPLASDNNEIVITSGALTNGTTTSYYYLYDLRISTYCEGGRTAIPVTVSNADTILVSSSASGNVCGGTAVTLIASSTNTDYTYTWTAANGFSATGDTIVINPTVTTTYTVSGTDGLCGNATTFTITVTPASEAGVATATPATVCSSGISQLSLTGYTGNIQWQRLDRGTWFNEIGATATASKHNVTVTETTNFRAIVTNSTCASDTSNLVTVTFTAPAMVSTTNATICGPGAATLTATGATGTTINWYRNQNDFVPLVENNDSLTVNVSATTTFYAEAVSGSGNIKVGPATPNELNVGTRTTFSLGGQLFDVLADRIIFKSVDIYPTTLGAGFSIAIKNSAGATLYTQSGITTVGTGTTPQTVQFNVPLAAGTGYSIVFNSFTPVMHNSSNTDFAYPFTVPGVISVTRNSLTTGTGRTSWYYFYNITAEAICTSGRVPVTATVAPALNVNLGNDTVLCPGSTLTLDAGNAGSTYAWSTGATSQTIAVTAAGTYWVDVTGTNGCVSRDSITVAPGSLPTAAFTYTAAATRVTFTNTGSTGAGTTYAWNFGDGNTSTSQNPVHVYTTAGTYTVELTVTNACGSVTTTQTITVSLTGVNEETTRNIVVHPNPTSGKFTISATGFGDEVNFTILNVTGQTVYKGSVNGNSNANVDLSKLASGVYMIRLETKDKTEYRRLVLDK